MPEKISGVVTKGEYYDFSEEGLPRYLESDRVFGVGNVVTGKGNIRASLVNSQEVTTNSIESYIGIADGVSASARFYAGAESPCAARAQAVRDRVRVTPGLSELEVAAIEQRIRSLQERVGYTGDYESWIANATPPVAAGQVNFAEESTHQNLPSYAAFNRAASH